MEHVYEKNKPKHICIPLKFLLEILYVFANKVKITTSKSAAIKSYDLKLVDLHPTILNSFWFSV